MGFFFPSSLWCRGRGIATYVLERASHARTDSSWLQKIFLAELLVISTVKDVVSVSYLLLFFILPSYLAKQFMHSNAYCRDSDDFWSGFTCLKQSLHQFTCWWQSKSTCKYNSLWLINDLASFFCPSLVYRCSICQCGFSSLLWLGDLALGLQLD